MIPYTPEDRLMVMMRKPEMKELFTHFDLCLDVDRDDRPPPDERLKEILAFRDKMRKQQTCKQDTK